MRSITSHPVIPHGLLAKNGNRAPNAGTGGTDKYAQGLPYHCDSSTACILCLLEPMLLVLKWWTPREELVAKQVLEKERRIYEVPSMALTSTTSITRLQVTQNVALNCYRMHTNIQHMHDKTLILPIHEHLHITIQTENTTSINTPRLKNPLSLTMTTIYTVVVSSLAGKISNVP